MTAYDIFTRHTVETLIKEYAMKTCGGVKAWLHKFLTSTALSPGHFTLWENIPGIYWMED
jgi:hypothetical protein